MDSISLTYIMTILNISRCHRTSGGGLYSYNDGELWLSCRKDCDINLKVLKDIYLIET